MTYETLPTAPLAYTDTTNAALLLESGPGRLGPYTQYALLYHCPADRSYIVLGGERHGRVRSYAMNEFISPRPLFSPVKPYEVYRRMSDYQNLSLSDAIVFADVFEDSTCYGRWSGTGGGTLGWGAPPASRHGRRGAFSFADGHVSAKKWRDGRTCLPVRRIPREGFPQPNNPDIDWVTQHMTALR